ncbi:MAG TPA: glycosyltransferase [Puia sp.]|nr:glycosyltransferase [Puia sp.]
MTIAFVHSHRSFLPELDAYSHFFSAYGIQTTEIRSSEIAGSRADLFWHFMGTDSGHAKKDVVTIHEYGSASVPPFRKWKDLIKRSLSSKPGFRIFLNEYVKESMGFTDDVPFGFRDMGIFPRMQGPTQPEKVFDFIYTGSLGPQRNIRSLLRVFTTPRLKDHSLLVLGKDYDRLSRRYDTYQNIRFKGPVPYSSVAEWLHKARFAINFMPDKEPFNQQSATKFLEYASMNIPIISSDYAWVKKFQQQYGGAYFFLRDDLSNFTWENVNGYAYGFPDLSEWSWEKQIRKSGVLEFIQGKFPELVFPVRRGPSDLPLTSVHIP